jgi:integrase
VPLLKRAGLPPRSSAHVRLAPVQKNIHPKFVQELLGDASVAITLDTYSHMPPGMGGEAATAMEDVLSQGASPVMPTGTSSVR